MRSEMKQNLVHKSYFANLFCNYYHIHFMATLIRKCKISSVIAGDVKAPRVVHDCAKRHYAFHNHSIFSDYCQLEELSQKS